MEEYFFLGRGASFPPRVDRATGRFITSSAEDNIRESIYIILMTRRHEYAMLPHFGCGLYDFVFELPDYNSITLTKESIISALILWEPRITDISVDVDLSDIFNGKVQFDIQYTICETNMPSNLVFPYYLLGGTESQ